MRPEPVVPRPPFFWLIAGLGAVLLAAHAVAAWSILAHGRLVVPPGWSSVRREAGVFISSVDPTGPAAGRLRPGDRLVDVDGDPRRPAFLAARAWVRRAALAPERPYTLTIEREGARRQVPMRSLVREDTGALAWGVAIFLAASAFLATGLLFGLRKAGDPTTRRATLASLAGSAAILQQQMTLLFPFMDPRLAAAFALALDPGGLQLALVYNFYSRFPASVREGRLSLAMRYLLLGAAGAVFAARSWQGWLALRAMEGDGAALDVLASHPLVPFLAWAYPAIQGVFFAALAAVVVRNFRRVTSLDEKRRLRWVALASALAFVPLAAIDVVVLVLAAMGRPTPPATRELLFARGNVALVAVAVSFVYAILKHRVFDIQFAVRRGLGYLLAKNVLRLALLLPLALLGASALANPHRTLAELVTDHPLYLAMAALSGVGLRYRAELSRWIDRRFFREAYDREQILLALVEEVKTRGSLPELARLVSEQLAAALHPRGIWLFYRDRDLPMLALGYSSGGTGPLRSLASDSEWLSGLEGDGKPRDVSAIDSLPSPGREWLAALRACLLVPINGGDGRSLGLLLLGEKKSEEPYSATDRRLLQAVAAQVAIAWENAALKEAVERGQRVEREVLNRLEGRHVSVVKECPACQACYDGTDDRCAADGASLQLSVPVERTIEGRYRLDRLIGKGGMGAVYEATDLRLRRKVAVKVMTGGALADPAGLKRFEREARTVARLRHPAVVTVFDCGSTQTGAAYLVMEKVDGATLRAELRRRGALDPATAAEWFDQVLAGIEAAHGEGIVHRDLKPENVLVAFDGAGRASLTILDFGLAKVRLPEGSGESSLTVPGTVMGTLSYMSPEQLSGHPVDERSDVFSLGVIVAEAVTGRHPFAAPSSPELVANILSRAFQLGEAPKGAERLGEALGRCLAKAPGDRFGSVTAMRAALIPALRTCPPLSRDGLPAAQATATGPGRVTATRMPPPPHPR